MTALDATALQDDPSGVAFLRKVIAPAGDQAMVGPKGFDLSPARALRPASPKMLKPARRETALLGC